MNISAIFIRRPVTTTLVMIGILIFGTLGYKSLPVSDLPTVDFPTITVNANLPGASAETMASGVATPLEKNFSTIAGLDSMSSTSSLGRTQITLQFSLSRNVDAAAQDVQAMIARSARDLPPNMPTPPSYRKVNPANNSILLLALTSPTLPLSTVDEFAQTILAQRISMVSGVAQVDVIGSQKYAVRIQLDPNQLAARQVGIDDVVAAVLRGNVDLPVGTLNAPTRAYTLVSDAQLTNAEAYKPMVVTYRNGAAVRIQDVGTAIDSVENTRVGSWFKDKRAVILGIQRQPGANVVEVVDAVKDILPALRAQIPQSINLEVFFDRTVFDSGIGARRAIDHDRHDRSGHPRDLLVPTQCVRHDYSQLGPADVDHRHVCRDVSARLQPGQPVADGADPGRWFRRRRRHRRSRKHRPPYGAGRVTLRSCGQRRPGNRLYDRHDDDLAGERFHPGAVYERHARTNSAGIFRHYLRGDSGFGVHLVKFDSHARQPLSPSCRMIRSMVGCIISSAAVWTR